MKRSLFILALAGGIMLALAVVGAARTVVAQGGADNLAPVRGAAVYAEFCQACHGPRGEARGTGAAFQAITYRADTSRDVIASGRDSIPDDGAAMPPYAQSAGGLLSDRQINDLIAYLETWETGNTPPLPQPNLRAAVSTVPDHFGDPQVGAVVYATSCYGCHGDRGKGRVPPHFPPFKVTGDSLRAVREGGTSPYMPAFAAASGGPLSEQDLENLDTYLASWSLATRRENPSPQGYSTLLIIVGVGAILVVGAAYMVRPSGEA